MAQFIVRLLKTTVESAQVKVTAATADEAAEWAQDRYDNLEKHLDIQPPDWELESDEVLVEEQPEEDV